MSFSAEIEHIWMPQKDLPRTLHTMFPDGVATVWTDEQFTAAIPATNDETAELADLFEIAAIALTENDPAMKAYNAQRDKLCGEKGYQFFSLVFKQAMEKQRRSERLASAARYN